MATTCRMLLVGLAVAPEGYEVRTRHDSLRVAVSRQGRAFRLGFRGRWREAAKGKLVQRLLAKQFEPLVPRPRIRLRRTR